MTTHPEIQAEQAHVDSAYRRLDAMREQAKLIASDVIQRGKGGTHQARLERDVLVSTSARRLAQLSIGSEALVFGRIDNKEAEKYYIGRLAVSDGDQEPLVVDWRAPVAEPFYRATGGSPMGLVRRRHLMCRGPRVAGIEDELLDEPPEGSDLVLVGEAALMASLERARTGRMRDIVETIQAEQDEIIRAPLKGMMVVQGGPGTGKTAVALHRAAYLLYTHRKRLEKHGVLLVGPNPIFIRYIEQVLPSLGEESVRLTTPGTIFARVRPSREEPPEASLVKGDIRMSKVLSGAVAEMERPLRKDVIIWYEDHGLKLSVGATRRMIQRTSRQSGTHNQKRARLEQLILRHLFNEYKRENEQTSARRSLADPNQERKDLEEHVISDEGLRKAVDEMWPLLSAEELVEKMLSSKQLLSQSSKGILSKEEVSRLVRPADGSWSTADVALLDEALSLLGPPPRQREAADEIEDPTEAWFIDQVLQDIPADPLMRSQITERIRQMYRDEEQELEEEPLFREYGHVLVDEAQDLSPMQWRMIARRCPSRSMTIVGDLGQASEVWAATDWQEVISFLEPKDGASVKELTINYRTPQEIMEFAVPLLLAATPGLKPPQSVRSTEVPPTIIETDSASLNETAAKTAEAEKEILVEGRVAIIAPSGSVGEMRRTLGIVASPDLLEEDIAVLTLDEAKGLEFDGVVVVEPSQIAAEHPHGLRALYVAFTRTTRRLAIVHSEPLPEELDTTGLT